MKSFIYIPHFLNSTVVDECLRIANSKREVDSTVGGKVNKRNKIRKDVFFSSIESAAMDEHIFQIVQSKVKDAFKINLAYRETYKVGTYYANDGGFYIPHTDTQGGMEYRNISCVICLSNTKDYEGGYFRFVDLKKTFKFDRGDAIIFDSNLLHEVKPVTSGKRQILASFMWKEENNKLRKFINESYTPALHTTRQFGDIDYSDHACDRSWTDNDDFVFEDNKSDVLIVTFAGMGVKESVPTFIFHNFLKVYSNIDKLFFRDLKCQYYVTGLKNQAPTLNETIELIKSKITSKKYSKIIGIGCSAGGYDAILFGHLLHFDKVIAFSPQTVLNDKKESLIGDTHIAYNTCKRLRQHELSNKFYHSCLDLKNFQPFRMSIDIHYAVNGNSGIDKKHALYLKDDKCNIIEHPGSSHMIALTLRNNGKLKNIIEDAIQFDYSK